MFNVRMLPAANGDSLIIQYGKAGQVHRVLIDGGTPGTWPRLKAALEELPAAERKFELLVVTHVDDDHIGGALKVLEEGVENFVVDEYWFNGYRHLKEVEEFGPVQGERLTTQLLAHADQWNASFGGKAVVVPDDGDLPIVTLPGGMKLTLLSPTRQKLIDLIPKWEAECKKAHLDPQLPDAEGDTPEGLEIFGAIDVDALAAQAFKEDPSEANGSSIAFIAEFNHRKVLFGADAHPTVLAESIARLPGSKVKVHAFKLPHHGSKKNLSPDLIDLVDTKRYLFSTNGAKHKHPDRQTIARILTAQKARASNCELVFNYNSEFTSAWDDDNLRGDWGYTTAYASDDESGIAIDA